MTVMMEFFPILKRIFLKNGFIGDQWQFYIILAKEILFLELCKFLQMWQNTIVHATVNGPEIVVHD